MKRTSKKEMIERFPRVLKERNCLDLMLYDVMNKKVTFGEWVTENPDAKYRVGISRTEIYPLAMLIFRSKNNGTDSIQVYDLEPWKEELRSLRAHSDVWEPVIQALLSAEAAVRAKFHPETLDPLNDDDGPIEVPECMDCGSPLDEETGDCLSCQYDEETGLKKTA